MSDYEIDLDFTTKLVFKKKMIDGKGRVHQPGQIVPDGFSSHAGLAEMIKAGDIDVMIESEQKPIQDESELSGVEPENKTIDIPDPVFDAIFTEGAKQANEILPGGLIVTGSKNRFIDIENIQPETVVKTRKPRKGK